MTIPRDAIGLSERLRQWVTDWDGSQMQDGEPPRDGIHCDIIREAATALDALLKERDALQARVKELEGERNFWKSERDRIKAFLSEGDWQTVESEQAWRNRALRAEQERDEAYERAVQAIRGASSLDENGYIVTKDAAIKAIRRLAAGTEKESTNEQR